VNIGVFLVVSTLALTSFAVGENRGETTDRCVGDAIKTFMVPLTSDPNPTLIEYKVEYHHARSPELPTIVFLPGGPGAVSIGKKHPDLPADYGYINTDPRSVGCNELSSKSFPDKSISSEMLANDVATVVASLGLKSYILYGQSYGTLLATVTAKRIEDLKMQPPQAVVLEGTLGKAFESLEEMNSEFVSQWNLVKHQMPNSVLEDLEHNRLPFGLSADEMGRSVQKLLMIGSQQGVYLPDRLFAMIGSGDAGQLSTAKTIFSSFKNPSLKDAAAERLYRLIACQEISPGNNDDLKLIDGKLEAAKPDLCGDLHFGKDKYDSKNFQIQEPIFYFNGERDPATPITQMQYHYESQHLGRKTKVIIPNAGHAPISFSLAACMPDIWKSIPNGSEEIRKLAAPCVSNVKIESKLDQ